MTRMSAEDRFVSRLNKLGPVPRLRPELGRCWEWMGELGKGGYGRISVDGVRRAAHRFSWELENGPIRGGALLDHACHNSRCARPSHLRLASHKENAENRTGPSSNGTTGFLGVTYSKSRGCYEGRVGHNGKRLFAGYHETAEAASVAVRDLRERLFTHNDLDRSNLNSEAAV